MKIKILLLIGITFCAVFTSNAQINTGRYLIGGSFNLYSDKYSQPAPGAKNASSNVNIQLGNVIKTNTVVGVILSYGYSNSRASDFPDSNFIKGNQYSVGVFYRKYKKLAKDFYFFGEMDAAYIHRYNTQAESSQNGSNGSKTISDGGSVAFIPGISYAICKRMQLEFVMPNIISLSYLHEKIDFKNTPPPANPPLDDNTFSFNANLNSNLLSNFGIGFKFLLGK